MTKNATRLEYQAACHFTSEKLAELFNSAFDGYVGGSFTFTAETFQNFIASQGVNLVLSQVVLLESEPAGLALIARRGWSSRLAAMGIVPEAKYQGVGTAFMKELLTQARARADRMFELEVIEQNSAGVRLYEKLAFKKLRRLLGFTLEHPEGALSCELEPVDIVEAASFITQHAPTDLPWQVGAFNLALAGEPSKAFKVDSGIIILSDPGADSIRLHNLTVARDKQKQGVGTKIMQSLFAMYPGKTWLIPALCPEEYQSFFEEQGFKKGDLSQFQMRLNLWQAV